MANSSKCKSWCVSMVVRIHTVVILIMKLCCLVVSDQQYHRGKYGILLLCSVGYTGTQFLLSMNTICCFNTTQRMYSPVTTAAIATATWLTQSLIHNKGILQVESSLRGTAQLKCDSTLWHTGGEVKGKLANGVGSKYPSHFLRTWCI